MAIDEYVEAPLSDLIDAFGKNEIREFLGRFRSSHESGTESFLRQKAIDMELRDLSRTYLFLDSSRHNILGFVTISFKCLAVPKENLLSNSVLRNMNIESKTGVAQSYLLGQLSRSADAPKGLGTALLDSAFDKFSSAKTLVGCRMVRLDCSDELVPYYSSYGFKLITENDKKTLNQMMAFVRSDSGSFGITKPLAFFGQNVRSVIPRRRTLRADQPAVGGRDRGGRLLRERHGLRHQDQSRDPVKHPAAPGHIPPPGRAHHVFLWREPFSENDCYILALKRKRLSEGPLIL